MDQHFLNECTVSNKKGLGEQVFSKATTDDTYTHAAH